VQAQNKHSRACVRRKGEMNKRKLRSFAFCALLLALWLPAEAQQPKKVYRIGFISPSSSATAALNLEAFRQGLRGQGYVEGENIAIEFRWAEGSAERLPHLVAARF